MCLCAEVAGHHGQNGTTAEWIALERPELACLMHDEMAVNVAVSTANV